LIVAPEFGPPIDKNPLAGIIEFDGNRKVPSIPVEKFPSNPIK
jgi:hypothetical protein